MNFAKSFKENPQFALQYESKMFDVKGNPLTNGAEPLRYYAYTDLTQYHMSRYVASNAQNLYSSAGITPDMINTICDKMIQAVNNNKLADVAVLANNLKYRTKYPVDEHAILRMAMIFMFVEGEDPNKHEPHWTEWKLQKVLAEPEAYSFFLPIGLEFTPAYKEYYGEVSQTSLLQRREALNSMQPI